MLVFPSSFNILWNDDRIDTFKTSRGIRQGDPLSPYLFDLCLEKLSHLIFDKMDIDEWVNLRAGRNGPFISHLPLADDILLFGEASKNQIDCILDCLQNFCNATSQRVSNEKTRIFLSEHTLSNIKDDIISRTGFTCTDNLDVYLGLRLFMEDRLRGILLELWRE